MPTPTMQIIGLDIRGQICPSCLLLTLKELNQSSPALRAGHAEIVVTTDDRQATATIPAAADRMGFNTEVSRQGEAYRIRIFTRT